MCILTAHMPTFPSIYFASIVVNFVLKKNTVLLATSFVNSQIVVVIIGIKLRHMNTQQDDQLITRYV